VRYKSRDYDLSGSPGVWVARDGSPVSSKLARELDHKHYRKALRRVRSKPPGPPADPARNQFFVWFDADGRPWGPTMRREAHKLWPHVEKGHFSRWLRDRSK
jgi:hypothetical protein